MGARYANRGTWFNSKLLFFLSREVFQGIMKGGDIMEYIIYNGVIYYFIEYVIKDNMLFKHFKSDNGNDVYLY